MIVGLLALIGAIVMATIILTKRAMRTDRVVKAWMIIPVNGIVVALTVALLGGGWYVFRRYQFDQCIARADRGVGNRAQTIQLYDTIDVATGTSHFTTDAILPGLPSLRDALLINLPALDPSTCHQP